MNLCTLILGITIPVALILGCLAKLLAFLAS